MSAGDVAAAPLPVVVEGFVVEGVHDGPRYIGVAGGFCTRGAVGDLAAGGGPALDRQEGLRNVTPAGIPLDTGVLNGVLSLEDQGVLRLEAVMDRLGPRVEVAHHVEHAVADPGGVDADVLDVEPFCELLDLAGLVLERLAPPAVLLQDPELGALLERWRDNHARCVVPGSARVIADPYRTVAVRPRVVRVEVRPKR